jgi:hypothetical protein
MSSVEDLSVQMIAALRAKKHLRDDEPALWNRIVAACVAKDREWIQVIDALRSERGAMSMWKKQIEEAAEAKRRKLRAVRDDEECVSNVRQFWEDAPVSDHATCPPGFGYVDPKEGSVYKIVTKETDGGFVERRMRVSFDPLLITKRIQFEDRSITIELAWRSAGRWQTAVYPRDMIMESRALIRTAARGTPIASNNSGSVVEYLQAYEHHNMTNIACGYSTSSMGWKGSAEEPTHDGFMCGSTQIGGNGRAFQIATIGDGDDEDVREISASGTFESWRNAIKPVNNWPVIKLLMYASLATPLLLPLKAPNMIIEVVGPTTGGKTTGMRIAQSTWRRGDFPIQTWNNTVNGFEAKAHVNTDMPLFIDDTKTAIESGKGAVVAKVIYQFISGRGRGRAARDGGQRPTSTWRSIMISTGEVQSSELAKAEGAATRVLSMWSHPTGRTTTATARTIETIESELTSSYGHAGPRLVRWLCEHRDRFEELQEHYQQKSDEIRDYFGSPAATRLAKVVALLDTAALVASYAEILPWPYVSLFEDPAIKTILEESIEHATSASTLAYSAWEDLCSYANSRTTQWLDWEEHIDARNAPIHGWLGRRGYDSKSDTVLYYGWEPPQLRRALDDLGYGEHAKAIMQTWRTNAILDVDGTRFSKSVKCGPISKTATDPKNAQKTTRLCVISTNPKLWTCDEPHGHEKLFNDE